MPSEDNIHVQGRVLKALPNAMFEVMLDNGHEILAHVSGRIRLNNIKIIVGDLCDVELSPYSLTVGRLTYRYK